MAFPRLLNRRRARAAAAPCALTAPPVAAIFAGGFCGAIVRALVGEALPYESGHWPWATLLVNVAGALLLGYVITRVEDGREPFAARRAAARAPASARR